MAWSGACFVFASPLAGKITMTLAFLFALTLAPAPSTAAPIVPAVAVTSATTARPSLFAILDAIRTVDSERATAAVGQDPNAQAIGPYCIDRARWRDAQLKGKFEDCRDAQYARCVVVAVWQRHCPEALARRDAEVLARVHAGGPNGAADPSTQKYWDEVKLALARR